MVILLDGLCHDAHVYYCLFPGLELADAEKGCSSGEGHLSVLRRIAEKLSSDSLAKDAKDAVPWMPYEHAEYANVFLSTIDDAG